MKNYSKITVAQLIEECKKYYAMPNNSMGGCLHIVLDDENIKDNHIKSCIDKAESEGDKEGVKLGKLLLQASMTQRRKLVKSYLLYCCDE